MLLRRLFYRWQFLAAIALPGWLLVGWGVFGGSGWVFPLLLVGAALLAASLAIVSGLMRARGSVRRDRALSWWDVAILAAWHAAVIGLGFFGPTTALFTVLGITIGLAGFWYSLAALLRETGRAWRAGVTGYLDEQTRLAYRRPPGPDGDVYVVRENP